MAMNERLIIGDLRSGRPSKNMHESRVIISQNCVKLSDAAFDDLLFSKICFSKSSVDIL